MISLLLWMGILSVSPGWHELEARDFPGKHLVARETLGPHLAEILADVERWKSLPKDFQKHWVDLAQLREYLTLLHDLSRQPPALFRAHLEKNFSIWKYSEKGLCTGYFTPVYPASLSKTERFSHPIHLPPKDLHLRRLPREKIVAGALEGLGLELAWLDNPLDTYLIHVQGSAYLSLQNGESLHLGYADSNGRDYSSLGKWLIGRGDIAQADIGLPAIRDYYSRHLGKLREDLNRNERYIYFQTSKEVPRGKLGFAASAMHTLAVDTRDGFIYPPLLAILLISDPSVEDPAILLGMVEDTGSAIVGPVRFDLYTGIGADAEKIAGTMIQRPECHFLWPNHWPPPKNIAGHPLSP